MRTLARRHALAAAAAITLSPFAHAQWNDNGVYLTTQDLVGIGTSSPQHRIHVVEGVSSPTAKFESTKPNGGALWALSSAANSTGMYATGARTGIDATATATDGRALFANASATTGTTYGVRAQCLSPDGFSGYFSGGKFLMSTSFAGVNRDWAINSTEKFGIFSTHPTWGGMYVSANGGAKPYYGYANVGNARAFHYYEPNDSSWKLNIGSAIRLHVGSNGRVGIGTVAPAGSLHVNGSAYKPGGGSWSNYSDERLKRDIEPIEGALDRLLEIRGVTFEYLEPESIGEREGTQLGVVAQEVEKVFPDWVDDTDDGFKSVTFRGFEGVAIEAMRELKEENDELRTELDELRADMAELKGLVERLVESR